MHVPVLGGGGAYPVLQGPELYPLAQQYLQLDVREDLQLSEHFRNDEQQPGPRR